MSDKPPVYVNDDGVAIYRASSLASCDKLLLLSRLGYEGSSPPDWMQQRFQAGHDHEPLILSRLQTEFEFELYAFQEEVEIPLGSKVLLRGHIDCMGTAGGLGNIWITHRNGEPVETSHGRNRGPFAIPSPFVIDAKAFAVSTWDKWCKQGMAGFRYYQWQMAMYCRALGDLPFVMAVKNKNTDEMRVEWFDTHLVEFSEIVQKVFRIEALAGQGEPAIPEQCNADGILGKFQYPCPFYTFHEQTEPEQSDISEEDQEQVTELANLYASASAAEKKAKDERARIAERLVKLLGDAETMVKLGDATVSTYHHVSNAYDWERMRADFAGLDPDDYKTKRKSEKLSVRVVNK